MNASIRPAETSDIPMMVGNAIRAGLNNADKVAQRPINLVCMSAASLYRTLFPGFFRSCDRRADVTFRRR